MQLRRLAGVDQLGGLIVFVVVAALLLGAFTGYLVWYGRWVWASEVEASHPRFG